MIKKIAFLLIIITGLLSGQRGEPDAFIMIPGSSGKLMWKPNEPNENEIVSITFEVTSSINTSDLKVSFRAGNKNTMIIGQSSYIGSIKEGETKRFTTSARFIRPVGQIEAYAYVRSSGRCLAIAGFSLYFDTLTNTFVSYKEYWSRRPRPPLPPEYTYDVVAGMHTGDVLPEREAKKLRVQMDSLKQLDSTLTDEEALQMLHDIGEPMVVRYGIHRKEEAIPILIKARKLMREQNLSKWHAVDKIIEEMKKERGKLNFFRPDRSDDTGYNITSDSALKQRVDITVTGTIKYKKHLIDKDIGLDTTTVDMPLRYVKVYFRGYYKGERAQYYGPCLTDNNGHFSYTIGGVSTPFYCMPLVFLRGPSVPSGPSGFNRVKAISDTIKFTWIPSPEDSQTWRYMPTWVKSSYVS